MTKSELEAALKAAKDALKAAKAGGDADDIAEATADLELAKTNLANYKEPEKSELINRYNAVVGKPAVLKINKETNLGRGTLTIGTTIVNYDIARYRDRTDLTPNQRAFADNYDENDGFVPCVLDSEAFTDNNGKEVKAVKTPFNQWLSSLKGLEGVTCDGEKLNVKQGMKYRMVNGTLLIA